MRNAANLRLAIGSWTAAGLLLAQVSVSASAWARSSSQTPSERALLQELKKNSNSSFKSLTASWQKKYGAHAVAPLLRIAKDRKHEDTQRYVALMSAAKLGGKQVAPQLLPLLKDKSWMLRAGTLRALSALGQSKSADPAITRAMLPLLKDPALVVRSEAVDALKGAGGTHAFAEALVETLKFKGNYHQGKAQLVPQKALSALAHIQAEPATKSRLARELAPLLRHENDPDLQARTVSTLESLTGNRLKPGADLRERVAAWRKNLADSQRSGS